MGWTSFPTTSQPTTQELNALVDAEFPPEATIIDRSGWLDHRHHRYTLLQLPSIEDATDPARHLISVTTVENRNDRINYKTIDETAGPFLYDCPSRIIKKAMTTPPLNAIAENWRLKVMNKHRRDREAERLLKDLKAQYPHGQLEFIVGGQQVLYRPAVYLGRKVHTYHLPRQNILHVLRREQIDLELTKQLRNPPPSPRASHSQENARFPNTQTREDQNVRTLQPHNQQ